MRIALILSLLVPLPIFFDLLDLKLVYSESPFGHQTKLPLPIGLFAFCFIMLLFYFLSKIKPNNYINVISGKARYVIIISIAFLFFNGIFIAGLSPVRLVQLLLPLLFFLLLSIPEDDETKRIIFFGGIIAFSIYISLHLTSLTLYSENLFRVTSLEFPMFFGVSIYQSLVSYPAVLSIFFTLLIYCYFGDVTKGLTKVLIGFSILIVSILMLLSARKSVFIELVWISFVLICVFPWFLKNKKTLQRWVLNIIAIFSLIAIVGFFVKMTPSFDRIYNSLGNSTFTGGRDEIFSKAIEMLSNDLLGFLFGFGGGDYSFHNFFLDLVFRLGLISTMVYFVALSSAGYSFFKRFLLLGISIRTFSFFCIIGQLFIQLLVNSPLTQPYYVINFCFVLLCLMYIPNNYDRTIDERSR